LEFQKWKYSCPDWDLGFICGLIWQIIKHASDQILVRFQSPRTFQNGKAHTNAFVAEKKQQKTTKK
jgi:hypothetical protein